jgi:tetratricopeptide (TPR) repeat protein
VIIAVVPFAADEAQPDAADLARFIASDTAQQLPEGRLLLDEVEITAEALGAAAAQLGADAAVGARLALEGEQIDLAVLLADATGAERAAWTETVSLGGTPQLGRRLAREILLALGENAEPESLEAEVPAEAMLRLVRGLQDPDELLALVEELPGFDAPRRALLFAAREAAGRERMPPFLAGLERLVELRPSDADALLALGDYRALHFDEEGARRMYLQARDAADEPERSAEALGRLAGLAESAGRREEAIAHLSEAVKLVDEAHLYGRLGALLLATDPEEGLRALMKATILAPGDGALHLQLLKALREHGDDPERTLAVAEETARLCEGDPELEAQVRAEMAALLGE